MIFQLVWTRGILQAVLIWIMMIRQWMEWVQYPIFKQTHFSSKANHTGKQPCVGMVPLIPLFIWCRPRLILPRAYWGAPPKQWKTIWWSFSIIPNIGIPCYSHVLTNNAWGSCYGTGFASSQNVPWSHHFSWLLPLINYRYVYQSLPQTSTGNAVS